MSDVIQAFLPVFWGENRQECLYHGGRTDRNACITGGEQTGMPVSREENRQECLYHVHLRYCCDPLAISDGNRVTEF